MTIEGDCEGKCELSKIMYRLADIDEILSGSGLTPAQVRGFMAEEEELKAKEKTESCNCPELAEARSADIDEGFATGN